MKKSLSVLAAGAMLVAAAGTAAAAGHGPDRGSAGQGNAPTLYAFDAPELNDSGVDASAQVQVRGDDVRVQVRVKGASPQLPHAMHIHSGNENVCPPEEAAGEDDILTVAEGVPFYGGIVQSLTTTGDAGPGDALALDRFPVADEDGNFVYNRTFTVGEDIPAEVVDNITDGQIVVHGFDISGDGTYGDSDAPLTGGNEATLPVACGEIG